MNSRSAAFANLCDEILFEIFKFLPLKERKNARLVCKQWYDVLIQKTFTENEILCIPNWYNLSFIAKILKNDSYLRFTLKFVCQDFNACSKVLWKTLGNRIKSLQFEWCTFDSVGLSQIFTYCVNLREFSAHKCSFATKPGWIFIIPKHWTYFSFGLPVRKNLKKFHFDSGSYSTCFKERDLFVISSVFPKLITLEIQLMLDYEDLKTEAKIPRFHISLSKLKKIKTFDIELHIPHPSLIHYYQFINFENMSDFDWNGKKNIQMNLNNFLLRVENLDRILSYKYWTSLVLFEMNSHANVNVSAIARLLDELPYLEKFKLCLIMRTEGDMDIKSMRILFPALVKSHLKYLHIEIPNFTSSTDNCTRNICSSWDDSLINYTVRHLSISVSGTFNSQFSSLLVKHFLGIRELHTEPGNPNIIFKHQKNLKSLIVHIEDHMKIENEILQLSSVQSLKFHNCQPWQWNVFGTHQFSNLRYLLLSCSKEYGVKKSRASQIGSIEKFESLLSSISSNCPNVEVFEFCWESYPQGLRASKLPGILQLCQQFQQLRYLSLKINYKEGKKLLKKSLTANFQQCPALRAVWLQLCCINLLGFVNVETKKYEFSEGDFTFVPESYAHSWMFK